MLGVKERWASPLLERETEQREFAQALTEAAAGNPCVLLVEGAPGIGKSRLLDLLAEMASAHRLTVLRARGRVLERELGWAVARQLLTAVTLELSEGERAKFLEGAAASAAPVLGLAAPSSTPLQLSEALHSLHWLTLNLSERQPLVLIVDDLQWADRESLSYLTYMASRLEEEPVLLAVSYRSGEPGFNPAELESLHGVGTSVRLSPQPLSAAAAEILIQSVLGDGIDPEVTARLHSESGGNPFLLRELCRELNETHGLSDRRPNGASELTVPERVSRAVNARLSRFPDLTRFIAEAATVLSSSATLHRIGQLTGAPPTETAETAGQLVEAEILRYEDHRFEFVHPLIRRAVYDALSDSRRALLHAQAAKLLADEDANPSEVASQLLHSMPAAAPWAVRWLRRAAAEARSAGAPETATRYLRRALIEPPTSQEMTEFLVELGQTELHHEPTAAAQHFAQAHKLADSPQKRAQLALLLAQTHALLADFGSALDVLNQAVDELSHQDYELKRQLDSARLVFARWDYRSQVLRHHLFAELRDRASAGQTLDPRECANLAHELAARGENRDAVASYARAAIENSDAATGTEDSSVLQLTSVLVLCDLCQEADAIAIGAVRAALARGSEVDASAALTLASYCALQRGALNDAIERGQGSLDRASGVWSVGAVAWLLEALGERGDFERAKALMSQFGLDGAPTAQKGEEPLGYQVAALLHHRAKMRALAGELEPALKDFRLVGELAEGWGVMNPAVLDWRSSAASVLVVLGQPEAAAELAHREVALARDWGAPSALGTALRVAGMVEPGPEGLMLLREAVDVHTSAPARLQCARSFVTLGVRLRRERQNLEAREWLRRGLDLAHRCGAVLLARQARDELVAAGGRPRRDALRGSEALTGRERRIAELAAEGLTNRQIAQTLFLSPRTVEHHLGSVYRKLGIGARVELREALLAQAPL